jgi:hypothetical protein
LSINNQRRECSVQRSAIAWQKTFGGAVKPNLKEANFQALPGRMS